MHGVEVFKVKQIRLDLWEKYTIIVRVTKNNFINLFV